MISAAQDTGGEEAAGQFFDNANAEFIQIIDENHTISTLYNMVNVPTGVWIDEQGNMVRPPEVAYSRSSELQIGGRTLVAPGDEYVIGLRDWVANGAESKYAMSPQEVVAQMKPRTSEEARAEALFQLGNHFHRQGDEARANRYWEEAERLRPDSWNYHRQDWSFTPSEAGQNWLRKFAGLGNAPYYEPPALPKPNE